MPTTNLDADPTGAGHTSLEPAGTVSDRYRRYTVLTACERVILAVLVLLVGVVAIVAVQAGSMDLEPRELLRCSANLAIIVFGVGAIKVSSTETITIDSPYPVTVCAFISAMAAVFRSFGDLGRVTWREVAIVTAVTVGSGIYFLLRRWDYNALGHGEETAKSLGANVERVRRHGMLVACLITAVVVSFVRIIGFIGLVGPQIMRRIIGGDHRHLISASAFMGSLLLVSDALARTAVSPAVLPVGANTAFFGAPLFLYLLVRGYRRW